MTTNLRISLEEIDQKIILRLEGKIDASSTPLLEKKIDSLIKEGHIFLLFDLHRIVYLSSAGLRLFLSAMKKLKEKKGGLILFSGGEEINEIIKMAGFDRIFPICSNEKEALQYKL